MPAKPPCPYARFVDDPLTLRDVLAVDRTIAANERTFLSYIRTSLAIAATGGSLLHFFDHIGARIAGMWLLGACGPMLVIGVRHYVRRRRRLVPLMGITRAPESSSLQAGPSS